MDTYLIKQRSGDWFAARNEVKVTGSTAYSALGCDELKRQREHFDQVVSGVEKPETNAEQKAAMQHGCESEKYQISTLSSIIMPCLYPQMIFYEEGYYKKHGIVASPDGSLRTETGIEYVFKGKAPVENVYKCPVHYEVPERYISQTILETDALKSKRRTLYLCYTNESVTLFEIPPNEYISDSIYTVSNSLYHTKVPKRPSRTSEESKKLKQQLQSHVKECIFVGKFPSVQGTFNSNGTGGRWSASSNEKQNTCHYDELLRVMLKVTAAVQESYELQRQHASQVVVYLLADLDRLWNPEEPHAVPVLYFYRGYSLSMPIIRKITEYCKRQCKKNGIDIVITCSDGEFLPLMVNDKNSNPLTLLQLSKHVWKKVCKLQKSEIVREMGKLDKVYSVKTGTIVGLSNLENNKVVTPKHGWTKMKKIPKSTSDELYRGEEIVLGDVITTNEDFLNDDVILGTVLEENLLTHKYTQEKVEKAKEKHETSLNTTILYEVNDDNFLEQPNPENEENTMEMEKGVPLPEYVISNNELK